MIRHAHHIPLAGLILLFTLGALTGNLAWTFAGFVWGVFWLIVMIVFLVHVVREDRRSR